MRIKTALLMTISVPLALAALAACSGGGGSTPTVDPNGKHPDNWVQQHWVTYDQANGGSSDVTANTACSECHSYDLSGGISKVSCFTPSLNGQSCHANADHTLGHPAGWVTPGDDQFHAWAMYNGTTVRGSAVLDSANSCGLCHATGSGGTQVAGTPSCLSTDPQFGLSCHSTSPAQKSSGCASCHGAPPNGTVYPNRAGSHAAHISVGIDCFACHSGYGTGTDRHATGAATNGSKAFMNFSTVFAAETGGFRYQGGSCSGVSCHGGKQTPAWGVGSINVATDCLSCHQQLDPTAPQYNSFHSGSFNGENMHAFHLATAKPGAGRLIFCTDCHNVNQLTTANHFGGLATPAFEFDPANTIGGGATSITTYNGTTTTCTNTCHTVAPPTANWE
ncbi:CxxxxCH/CxxCH domain-containing protein [Geomonas sp. Red32]|uniref:CxxxxCH/CxxCH domain c-type cytochrome n=1 Tax=Geomonas sp. Red32 TaxID=2912856 RepID=UPI00202CAF45|nr:CxxxxCH/CxxCH domain-containing protein [Geomonas sp. Red32]MCM0082548.1 CxxxxCH/CxxCH domain-containing protein [Geomonas sp. Red32]